MKHLFSKYIDRVTLTRAPMTPKLVNLRYSNGRVLLNVCRNGYRNKGMWAVTNIKKMKVGEGHIKQSRLPVSVWLSGYTSNISLS